MTIKTWFLNKEFTANERMAIAETESSIKRETEKAFLLRWDTEYGTIERWVPKSCISDDAAAPVATTAAVSVGSECITPDEKTIVIAFIDGLFCTADNGKRYLVSMLKSI